MINPGKSIKRPFGPISSIWKWANPYYFKWDTDCLEYFPYNSATYGPFFEKNLIVFNRVINNVLVHAQNELSKAKWWIRGGWND